MTRRRLSQGKENLAVTWSGLEVGVWELSASKRC